MFGIFKKKAKVAQAAVAKIENRDLMEAIVAASVLVAYADGECGAKEMKTLEGIIASNDSLKHFGSEIGKTIDKYSTMYESGARLANMKLMREIADVDADEQQKEEVFIIAIEIADADGSIEAEERAVLEKIGKTLGLSVDMYI